MIDRLVPIITSRWFRLVLVGLVLLGLQTTLFSDVRPFGVVAQLMLLLAVAAGVTYGLEVGAVAGLVLGFMYDCVLNTPLGLCSLVFGGAGAVAGALPFFIREPSWWLKIAGVALATLLAELAFPFALSMVGIGGWVRPRMFVVALGVTLINLVFAPLALIVSRWTLKANLGN
jgi:rod shape-determining protein MreD